MKTKQFNIIDSVVNQDLCTGCGACMYKIQSNDLKMDWNQEGFLVPTKKNSSVQIIESAIYVCPFNPQPAEEVRTENELADIFLQEAPNHHPKVGRYFNNYVGYSEQYRLTSSSGGIATYILNELFKQNLIDAVITVGEGKNNHYEYKLVKSKEELRSTSKTKYYPVTMAEVLNELKSFDGKIAVVGIGCFIKSVRLLQHYHAELKEKIVFTVGIICGGLKSNFFAEYLANKAGVVDTRFSKPEFRIKDYNSSASDYAFGCVDVTGEDKLIKMQTVGDMWGTGMFKCNACDFCDDVTTELADVSLGDAWILPYNLDGKGTNVIVTRSALAEELINNGIQTEKLKVQALSFETFLSSQQGSFNHRQKALKYRIQKVEKQGAVIPPKRHSNENISFDFKWVQNYRMKVRAKSLCFWKFVNGYLSFEKRINFYLFLLLTATRIYHHKRSFLNKYIAK
jgi:coenzyme F420 hydrogenase subunit beta